MQISQANEKLLAWVGDAILPRESAKVSVFDSVVQGGDSVWEGLGIYKGKIFKLEERQVKEAIVTTLIRNGMFDNAHIRLSLTRGKKCRDWEICGVFNFTDDSMAILMAFQCEAVDILGLTTIFGNVLTEDASRNALLLCEIAGRPDVPVAEGSHEPLKGGKPRVADFVHGSDGLGNIFLPPPNMKKSTKNAAEFLVDKVSEYPGEVTVLALGPLTNIALAIKRDSSFASKVKKIVVLGGAFFSLGNVNPAAEANIYGDPEADDVVFTSGANVTVVGINITTQVKLTDKDLQELRDSKGKHCKRITDMCKFYRDWHVKSDGVYGIFLHDPVSFVAVVRPDLFTYKKGVVRVETQGVCVGHTLLDQGLKKWNTDNPWTGYSPISVAWTVNVEQVLTYIKNQLIKC